MIYDKWQVIILINDFKRLFFCVAVEKRTNPYKIWIILWCRLKIRHDQSHTQNMKDYCAVDGIYIVGDDYLG